MIEEIQAILPLLEKISDGALYAFMLFMFVQVISVIIWPLSFMFVFKCAPNIIKAMWGKSNTGTIDFYKLNYKGRATGFSYIGSESDLLEFLGSLSYGSYLHGSDLKEFIKKDKK
jgi:hypothetical protein